MSGTASSMIAAAAAGNVAAQTQLHHHQQQQQQQQAAQAHQISLSQLQLYQPTQGAAYQLPHVYPQMFIPGNVTLQNTYPAPAGAISLQNHTISQTKPGLTSTAGRTSNTGQSIKSATIVPPTGPQYTTNNPQAVVISQMPSIMTQQTSQAQQTAIHNSKILEAQKAKHFMFQSNNASTQQKSQMIPNSSMVPQSIVNTQFKPQLAAMMNPPMCQLASLPHALAWTPTQPALMAAPNQPIILRASQPDGQHVFFQTSNQPIYVNQNNGAMHVMSASAHQNLSELHPPMISSAVVSSAPSSVISAVHTSKTSFSSSAQTATNNPTVNLNSSNHRARNQLSSSSIAVQQQPSTPDNPKSMNNRSKIGGLNNHSTSPGSNRSSSVGSHQSSRDVFQIGHNPSSAATQQKALAQQKSTQQMNAELLLKAGNTSTKIKQLGRSDSTRSLNSQGSEESKFYKNGESSKKSKDDSKHLNGKKLDRREISTENIEMNTSSKSQSNGTLKKSEKKKLGLGKSSQKTQVLTHCIDGHIILESSVPFPVLPNLSNTLRDRSNGIANQMNESNSLAAPDLINSKPNASGAVHSNAMQISTTSASATSKEVRIKNKKLKKSKLKAANQAALLARANGHIDEKNGSITTMPAPGTIVSIPGTLIPFETNMPQTITISKAATLASGLAQLTPQLADQTIAVCNGPNLTGHSTSLINGILVNDSVMELDESSFMQKQKIASTPIKEPSLNHQVPLNNPTSTGSTSAMPSLSNDKPVHWWSVQEVHDYVAEESGNECAKVLLDNHIDGRALLALTVPIMKDELKLKLGPVLVLKAKIDELGQKFKDHDKNPDYLPAEPNIYKWTVKDVYHFVLKLASKEHAEEFEKQEMDGHALTLLSQEHIMNDMQMKFGPGLKILSKVKELKKLAETSST